MQIIKVWLKITAVLAVLGWFLHWASPDFAAWLDGVFSKKDNPVVVELGVQQPQPAAESIPPSDAGAIRATEKDDAKRVPRAPYHFNQ
ncbi:hypothetical protein [Micavibrio aeruginosavorus]|uniref:hypothetical protein n=1 Tax=Micavibrio aeruginosavorus TaxID=349221 RepID=UPI003F4AA01A